MCCQYFKITAPRSVSLSCDGSHTGGVAVLQREVLGGSRNLFALLLFSPFKQCFYKHNQGGRWLHLADRLLLSKFAKSDYSLLLKAVLSILNCYAQSSAGTTQSSAEGFIQGIRLILPPIFLFQPSKSTCSSSVRRCILKVTSFYS